MGKYTNTCQYCELDFSSNNPRQIYCTTSCGRLGFKKMKDLMNGSLALSTGSVGAIAEIMVCVELMRCGYDVFRAMSPSSDCDILAVKGEFINKIEVRTGNYYRSFGGVKKVHFSKERTTGKKVIVVTHVDKKIHFIDELDGGTEVSTVENFLSVS